MKREYSSWRAMKTRCYNKNNNNYRVYGARGITICDEWRNSFDVFLLDMGPRPENFTLDRIDNSKGYYPDNCRWANNQTQGQNRRLRKGGSGYRGVVHTQNKWMTRITINKKRIFLGRYDCKHEAAMVFDMYKEKHGIHPYKLRHIYGTSNEKGSSSYSR